MSLKCILFVPASHRLALRARELICGSMTILKEVDADNFRGEDELAQLKPDYIISFLNPLILRGPLLNFPNINFHPAPPEYPGRGSASYALYENSPTFGATAHQMVRRVDAGDIYFVRRFAIDAHASCAEIFERSENMCIDLLQDFLSAISSSSLKPCGETWKREAGKRKDFEKWLVLDPLKPEEFSKKIRAARHPRFKGPYVYVNGYRFALDEDGKS